jgi:uncharacterized protein YyaL (SSP411 family)
MWRVNYWWRNPEGVRWSHMPNALARETSPYLLQHAHNPVDWQPWGEDAFARAKAEGKLVYLSVGYSTCHWCHVMERESFEVESVAAVMNRHFINVKVDREERPDIDATYMAFVQATTGQGGWPMSVWLTPDGRPVVGGTYFPPEDRYGKAGFVRICEEIARVWKTDHTKIERGAREVMEKIRGEEAGSRGMRGLPGGQVFGRFLDECDASADPDWGGFGHAPKFPRPVAIDALLRMIRRFGRDSEAGMQAWELAERNLRAMAAGGMHDHMGGGFHRYSVDRYWHVPHYEKMLYDQAQLALAYLDAWQISGDPLFRDTACGIFDYVLRDMKDSGGAFHAAEDADSLPVHGATAKSEGAYWTWDAREIAELLAPADLDLFLAAYGVLPGGNARPESDPHGELEGRNTLYRAETDGLLAEKWHITAAEVRARLDAARCLLLAHRYLRPKPHRDDKIITAWNGLMIGALARGARVLGRIDLAEAARKAAGFLRAELWDGERLFRSFRGRRGDVPGFPADYAFLISGLLELQALPGGESWLVWAAELQSRMDVEFWDADATGYVMRPELGGEILMTIREEYDGAEPAPNHVAACNLLKISAMTGDAKQALRAESLVRAGCGTLESRSFGAPVLLAAYDLLDRGVARIECRGEPEVALGGRMRMTYLPETVWTWSEGDGDVSVCSGDRCSAPIRTVSDWNDRWGTGRKLIA